MSAVFSPPQVWRDQKNIQSWIGKRGKVVFATRITVAPPHLEKSTPYSYALVDFGSEKHEFLVTGHDDVQAGDTVECVVRRLAQVEKADLIPYGIKVKKV